MLDTLKTVLEIIVAIFTIIWFISLYLVFFSKKLKLYKILSKNLSRKIAIISPNNWNELKMENELKMLDNKIFWDKEIYTSYNNFKIEDNLWLVIVWYKKWAVNIEEFDNLVKKITSKNLPIIFYTYWDANAFERNENDEFQKSIKQCSWNYLVNNFSLRLLWDVFSLMSIYK